MARLCLTALLLCTLTMAAAAQNSTTLPPAAPAHSQAGFDVHAAGNAYLAKMPPAERARSDSYFAGGYWLLLWDFLATMAIMWIFLQFRWSLYLRRLAERMTRFRPLQTGLYWIPFVLISSLLQFPLTVYESYFREKQYGLLNQTFGAWLHDELIALAAVAVLGACLMIPLFGLIRMLGQRWWMGGAMLSVLFLALLSIIEPVYLAPLFNTYTTLQDPQIKEPILSMARANGIPATNVYEFDASRQSKRVSANVSGFAGAQRISLNDNLLKRCTLPEIEATMGHEMGHYVLHHDTTGLVMYGILVVIAFAFLNWALRLSLARWGERWGIRDIKDVAVLPLGVLLLSCYLLLVTPVGNTISRTMEFEADMYGLNAARQPDGAANVDLLLGEYRKLDPGPLEEILFYDHPSGRTRITAAMRWKAEHPETASPEEAARPIFAATSASSN